MPFFDPNHTREIGLLTMGKLRQLIPVRPSDPPPEGMIVVSLNAWVSCPDQWRETLIDLAQAGITVWVSPAAPDQYLGFSGPIAQTMEEIERMERFATNNEL